MQRTPLPMSVAGQSPRHVSPTLLLSTCPNEHGPLAQQQNLVFYRPEMNVRGSIRAKGRWSLGMRFSPYLHALVSHQRGYVEDTDG
jgi:hypothetical protein